MWKLIRSLVIDFDEYQRGAARTKIYPVEYNIIYPALEMAGEAGEICNKVKKYLRDDKGVISDKKREEVFEEMGDVLWAMAAMASDLGYTLSQVAEHNLAKLQSRQERGVLGGSGDRR